jgi:hypothetical protein
VGGKGRERKKKALKREISVGFKQSYDRETN